MGWLSLGWGSGFSVWGVAGKRGGRRTVWQRADDREKGRRQRGLARIEVLVPREVVSAREVEARIGVLLLREAESPGSLNADEQLLLVAHRSAERRRTQQRRS